MLSGVKIWQHTITSSCLDIFTCEKACHINPLNLICPLPVGEFFVIGYISSIIQGNIMEAYKNTIFGG